MKTSFATFSVVAGLLAFGLHGAFAQKETLAIAAIKATPSLAAAVKASGKANPMDRVLESMDGQLINRINETRKFDIISRSDLAEVIKEQELANSGNVDASDKAAAKQFKVAGAKYLLITTVDDFLDLTETQKFEGTGRTGIKRNVKLSSVAKIYDSTTGKLLESANFQINKKDAHVNEQQKDNALMDELLVQISREMADKVANRVADVIFPAKVLVKRDKQITVNRGDGTGIAVDQIWNVYAVGEELIDPDTNESLGKEEVLVGKAKVVSVNPKTSIAEILEDNGVDKGAVLRLPQGAKGQ